MAQGKVWGGTECRAPKAIELSSYVRSVKKYVEGVGLQPSGVHAANPGAFGNAWMHVTCVNGVTPVGRGPEYSALWARVEALRVYSRTLPSG